MQSFRKRRLAISLVLTTGLTAAAMHASVPQWQQWIDAASAANTALYRSYETARGTVSAPRPPQDAANDLAQLADQHPSEAALTETAARAYEEALDFGHAEARWKQAAARSADPAAGQIALADYYHRRRQAADEMAALIEASRLLPATEDPLLPNERQRAWGIYQRALALIHDEALPAAAAVERHRAWIAKYPQTAAVYRRAFEVFIANRLLAEAESLTTDYERAFPADRVFGIDARAALAAARGNAASAIAYYDNAFDPLWPRAIIDRYFKMMRESHTLYAFYTAAQRAALDRPLDLQPAARLFWHERERGDDAAARRVLAQFRMRKEASGTTMNPAELRTLAALYDAAADQAESVRYYFALYSLPGVDDGSAEAALAGIIATLLQAPHANAALSRGSLSFYRDIATMDPSPGFLNGVLSLLFNAQTPNLQFDNEQEKARPYFQKVKAAELYPLFAARFPESSRLPNLLARLIDAYESLGDDAAVIRHGNGYLDRYPAAPERVQISLQMAHAYARQKQTEEELAVYDRALADLAAEARQVPLGDGAQRSAAYATVLDRYIARLVELERIDDALRLYRKEIDRNPNDPGLYDRLASFLEQNERAPEAEQVYQKAVAQFQNNNGFDKLARYYLRYRRTADFDRLSRQIAAVFSGSELERYVSGITPDRQLDRRAALQITLYARQRFPHDMVFVRRLIRFYADRSPNSVTADPRQLMTLLEQHWFEDEEAREMYLERLSREGALPGLISAAPADAAANPAAARLAAEAAAWLSHFEEAAPLARTLAAAYPADPVIAGRAVELFRSLAYDNPANTTIAASIAVNLAAAAPRNREAVIRAGEIHADRDDFAAARLLWNRLPEIEPGKPDSYIETATSYWDYFQYADALRWLETGRRRLGAPALWGYQAGALFEAQNRPAEAVAEYLHAALAPGADGNARSRLQRLSTRAGYRETVDRQTSAAIQAAPDSAETLGLRVDVLRAQSRFGELDALLTRTVQNTRSHALLDYIANEAAVQSLTELQARVLRREFAIESNPEEKIRLRLRLVRLLENTGNSADVRAAADEMRSIYRSNSLLAGVIREAVDFYWRRGDRTEAIRILADTAARADASLKSDYLREAARKALDAGRHDAGSKFADTLLTIDPLKPESITLKAEALARQGRPREARLFYTSSIDAIRKSPAPAAERLNAVAQLRRELIPVLAELNDFAGIVDQYIEIVNAFPEDAALVRETSRTAARHGLQGRLVDYYNRTVAASPKDPRWAIVLARIETAYEHFPAAIAAYSAATAARPERIDLAQARADLEERGFRFADAIATYRRVFELSHGDPQWLERIAVLEARLGRNTDAAATLERAYVAGLPERSRQYDKAAIVLEQCGLIEEAARFMERQAAADAGKGAAWMTAYARILTRARRQEQAFDRVYAAENSAPLDAMGEAVKSYFTPEEKAAFAQFLTARQQTAPDPGNRFASVARSAGLYDLAVTWSLDRLASTQEFWRINELRNFEERRMRMGDYGRQLERMASASSNSNVRTTALREAAEAYRKAGEPESELRVLGPNRTLAAERYFELLAGSDPDQLTAIAASAAANDPAGDQAIQALLNAGDSTRALAALRARGAARPAVWTDAYTGLTGIYFGLDAEVRASFGRALGAMTIGDRIGKPADRDRQIVGGAWFYYGARYGEYLDAQGLPEHADYLASQLEKTPADIAAYRQLARFYQDSGAFTKAVAQYRLALQIDTERTDLRGDEGVALWDAGSHREAIEVWKNAIALAKKQLQQPLRRATAADRAAALLRSIHTRGQRGAVQGAVDDLLESSLPRLNSALAIPLTMAAFEGAFDVSRLKAALRGVQDPLNFLWTLSGNDRLGEAQREVVFHAAVDEAARQTARPLAGHSFAGPETTFRIRMQFVEFLLGKGRADRAQKVLDTFTERDRRGHSAQLLTLELQAAALSGGVPALLDRYAKAAAAAPGTLNTHALRSAALDLERLGHSAASQAVLEFLYRGQIEAGTAGAAEYTGLAEILLRKVRIDEALSLLRTVNFTMGAPFENFSESAAVLRAAGRVLEAEGLLKQRLEAAPWDEEAHLDYDSLRQAAGHDPDAVRVDLARLAASPAARYATRVEAVKLLASAAPGAPGAAKLGSRELELLAGRGVLDESSAAALYFHAARIAAARAASPEARLRLLLDALAENPDDFEARMGALKTAAEIGRNDTAAALGDTIFENRDNDARHVAPAVLALIGEIHMRLAHYSRAFNFFNQAGQAEPDAAMRSAYTGREKAARAALDRQVANQRRRPVIGPNLEQTTIVGRMQ